MVKNKVKYAKEYKLNSPLYLSYNSGENEFYQSQSAGRLQIKQCKGRRFGWSAAAGNNPLFWKWQQEKSAIYRWSQFAAAASGEKTELNLGQAFDIFASGKISSAKKISEKVTEASVEITFNNAKDEAVEVEFIPELWWNLESQRRKRKKWKEKRLRV